MRKTQTAAFNNAAQPQITYTLKGDTGDVVQYLFDEEKRLACASEELSATEECRSDEIHQSEMAAHFA
jgi:hypothetical protein